MGNSIIPRNGNDMVMTPPDLALKIVKYLNPTGKVLEPCRGAGAFTDAFSQLGLVYDWTEIGSGKDFITTDFGQGIPFNWVITNPPWSQYRAFLKKSLQISNNVAFLSLANAAFMKARLRDARDAGFGLSKIILVPTPPKPWPQFGIQLSVTVFSKTGPFLLEELS